MKNNDTYKVKTDEGRVLCGTVKLATISSFFINGEKILFCDLESFERIHPYKKRTTSGLASKLGIPR